MENENNESKNNMSVGENSKVVENVSENETVNDINDKAELQDINMSDKKCECINDKLFCENDRCEIEQYEDVNINKENAADTTIYINGDAVIVGSGAAGLYCALNLPENMKITIISKDKLENSDSFLAQGGICMLRDEADFDSFYEDTMKAGHYEHDPGAVSVMINSSQSVIRDLVSYGVDFEKSDGQFAFTREGAHSKERILFHQDVTGKEITSHLLEAVKKRRNVTLMEDITMTDLIIDENGCNGIIAAENATGRTIIMNASHTVLATGGIGGLYEHSTNFPHLTGDSLTLAKKYGIKLKNLDYVQIHPTTLYSEKPGRRFLISESVRGEGALLYDKDMKRFTEELLPRDKLTQRIREKMAEDGTKYVLLDMRPLGVKTIMGHFPNIYQKCLDEGYDVTKECIPVVPAQHYFMGGIQVDLQSRTSMKKLYAVGETACNGVHGKNRLASNSLLESLVFAKRAAFDMVSADAVAEGRCVEIPFRVVDRKNVCTDIKYACEDKTPKPGRMAVGHVR